MKTMKPSKALGVWCQSGLMDPRIAKLTVREITILFELRQDKLDKEIADSLGISIHTLRVHMGNIFRKLGVRTRVGAAVFWDRSGWHENSHIWHQ